MSNVGIFLVNIQLNVNSREIGIKKLLQYNNERKFQPWYNLIHDLE